MVYRRLCSGFILAIVLTIGLLVNFAGLAKADVNEQENTSVGNTPLLLGLALPPTARFEKPLLQNTPVLTITKIAPQQVTAGQTLTYTIIVSNSTITDATNATISDTLDTSKLTFAIPLSASYDSGIVTWEPITISGFSSITRTLLVTVNADVPAGEVLTNTVGVTSTEGAGDSDTVTSTITTAADISIGKSSNPTSTVVAGEALTYTLMITNNGPSDAQTVVVTDTLADTLPVTNILSISPPTSTQIGQTLGWVFNNLTSGVTRTITIAVQVPGLVRGSIENTATVTSTTTDPYTNDNSHTISTDVDAEVDLVLTKTATSWDTLLDVRYELRVTNNGPSDATNVTLTDNLPLNADLDSMPANCSNPSTSVVTCDFGTITSGNYETAIIWVKAIGPSVLVNQAQVTSDETESNPSDNFDEIETLIQPTNLSIGKVNSTAPIRIGYPFTYTVIITNSGPNIATGIVLTDDLSSDVQFQYSTPGSPTCNETNGTVTCNLPNLSNVFGFNVVSVEIVVIPTVTDQVTNTARVSATQPDPDPTNNTISITTTIDPVTDLAISKTASSDPVTAGESLIYTITITNDGPSDATGIIVTDTLTAGLAFSSSTDCSHSSGEVTCTLSSLLNGGSHTFDFEVDVNPGARGSITNNATVTGNEFDPVNNNSASTETIVNAETNLSISKSANPSIAVPGESLTYIVTITNSGPSNATGLVVTDTLPSGVSFDSGSGCSDLGGGIVRCTLSDLARNDSHSFTLNTSVDASVTQTLQNEVSATSSENSVAVSDTLLTGVNPQTDLDITKTASPGAALPGDTITYILTVYNNGPSDATGIVVTDTLPASVTFQSVTPSAPTCLGTGTIVCTLGDLAANGTPIEVTIEITVNEDATGTISNQATVSGNEEDPSAGNNISPQVSTAIGEFNKIYLPIIIKPAPTNLYIENDTSGQVIFTVFGAGVSCTVPAGAQNHHCGDFPPGTYTVRAVTTQCGTGTTVRTYASGYQKTRVFCN